MFQLTGVSRNRPVHRPVVVSGDPRRPTDLRLAHAERKGPETVEDCDPPIECRHTSEGVSGGQGYRTGAQPPEAATNVLGPMRVGLGPARITFVLRAAVNGETECSAGGPRRRDRTQRQTMLPRCRSGIEVLISYVPQPTPEPGGPDVRCRSEV